MCPVSIEYLRFKNMNMRKKGGDTGKSDLASKLLGTFGHVHNPFSMDSRKDHDVEVSKQDSSAGDFRTMNLQVEMTKAEANLVASSLFARIQKS